MSSILKALKRIEGQSPPSESFPALPEAVNAKQAVSSNARRRWLLRRGIAVGLILLVLGVLVVIGYQQRQFVLSKIFPARPTATNPPTSAAPADKSKIFRAKISSKTVQRTPDAAERKQPVGERTKALAAAQKTSKLSTDTRTAESGAAMGAPASSTRPAVAPNRLQPRAEQGNSTRQQPSRQMPTPSRKSIAGKQSALRKPAEPAATAAGSQPARTYSKLNDSSIKLQALAWSSDAARRMAVINGRIVREGESMDGYQINQIRQEDVVVSDGQQLWRLEFGLKQ